MKKKQSVRKPKYKASYCLKWLLQMTWEWDKKLIVVTVLLMFLSVALYALNLYIPSIILDRLENSEEFQTVALTITALLAAQFLFQLLKILGKKYSDYSEYQNAHYVYWLIKEKESRADYYLNLDQDYSKLMNRAYQVLNKNNMIDANPMGILFGFANVTVNILCFFLFGSVISMLSPWIIVFLAAGVLLGYFMKRRVADKNNSDREPRDENQKKLHYYSEILPSQYKSGKDIRVFGFMDYIDEKWNEDVNENIRLARIVQNRWTFAIVLIYLIEFLRDGTAYLYLLRNSISGGISPAQFVLYFSAISQMSKFMSEIFDYFTYFHESMLRISDYIEFLCEERGKCNHGKGIMVPKNRPVSIELRDVTFRYPGGDKNVLEHVSMKIEAGENISVVGANGAGKTTLTLLICGLLIPDEGEVLIDGHPVREYNRDELYGLFSVVPQKYSVMPVSIAENIGMCTRKEIDDKRLWECVERVGLSGKVKGLKNGIETGMNKMFDADAVEFSGGEMQRLLLARALYRDASVLILDEPTAALDPVAEDEVYRKYNEFSKNATSLFISHRMASTRFCDRIYLLDGAKIGEMGTHVELMKKNGKYAEMFRMQSKYYQDEPQNL